jgi:hypothetical protein
MPVDVDAGHFKIKLKNEFKGQIQPRLSGKQFGLLLFPRSDPSGSQGGTRGARLRVFPVDYVGHKEQSPGLPHHQYRESVHVHRGTSGGREARIVRQRGWGSCSFMTILAVIPLPRRKTATARVGWSKPRKSSASAFLITTLFGQRDCYSFADTGVIT